MTVSVTGTLSTSTVQYNSMKGVRCAAGTYWAKNSPEFGKTETNRVLFWEALIVPYTLP